MIFCNTAKTCSSIPALLKTFEMASTSISKKLCPVHQYSSNKKTRNKDDEQTRGSLTAKQVNHGIGSKKQIGKKTNV